MTKRRNWETDFDHTDPVYAQEIWDVARRLRTNCPVARGKALGGFAAVSRFADVRAVLQGAERFTSRQGVTLPPLSNPFPALPNETDGAEHRAYRALIMPWLNPAAVADLEPAIRELVDEQLDTFAHLGRCDFIRDFSYPLPAAVISMVLGLPRAEWRQVKDRFGAIVSGTAAGDQAAVQAGWAGLIEYLQTKIKQRRRGPADDVLGRLCRSEVDGRLLGDDELLGLVFTLVTAGQDTTSNTMGLLTRLLAEDTDLRDRLIADPSLIPDAIEEMLRWWGPVQTVARTAAVDTEIAGCPITHGEKIAVLIGAANRDDTVFPDAEVFDLDREGNRRHLGFGAGEHVCAGAHLARLELRIVFERLLARIPDFALAGEPVVSFPGGIVYGLSSLPLSFTPERRVRVRFRPADAAVPANVGPFTVRTLVSGDETDRVMSIIEYNAPVGAPAEEAHTLSQEDAAIIMLRGTATFEADGERFTLDASASLYVARGVPMRRVSVEGEAACYLIVFVPGGLDKFFAATAALIAQRSAAGASMDEIMPEVRRIQAQYGIE